MKPQRVVLVAFVLALVPLVSVVPQRSFAAPAQTQPVIKEIELKAKKYEYAPNRIDVALNTVVRFKITAEDNDHGFEIEGVKESKTDIPKGTTKVVEFKADKAGTFPFKCSKFCGLGHGRMKGSIVVK